MLILNELIGFGASEQVNTTISFLQSSVSASDLTTYTFSSQNLGVDDSNRWIIVAVGNVGSGADRTINSVTVGGISATQIVTSGFAANRTVDIWAAAVPTGTTGDIVVTNSGACVRCGYSAWRLITGTPASSSYATGSDTTVSSGDLSASLNVPQGGVIVAACQHISGSGTETSSWTNVSEDWDSTFEVAINNFSGGHASYTSSPLTVTASSSPTATTGVFAAASFS